MIASAMHEIFGLKEFSVICIGKNTINELKQAPIYATHIFTHEIPLDGMNWNKTIKINRLNTAEIQMEQAEEKKINKMTTQRKIYFGFA